MFTEERDHTSIRGIDSEKAFGDAEEGNYRCGGKGAVAVQVFGWEGVGECGTNGLAFRVIHTVWKRR